MMSLEQRGAYLEEIKKRYKKSNRQGKARILDEFYSVCNYNRKYAIRLLKKRVMNKHRIVCILEEEKASQQTMEDMFTFGGICYDFQIRFFGEFSDPLKASPF
jgi:hypothetical protein